MNGEKCIMLDRTQEERIFQISGAIDGLMMVDLARTDARTLERYMGREGAGAFLEVHQQQCVSA